MIHHLKARRKINAIQQTLRTLFAGVVALLLSQNSWLLLTALLLVQVRWGNNFFQQFLAIFLLGIITVGAIGLASVSPFLSIFVVIAVTLSVSFIYPEFFIAAMVINVMLILSTGLLINTDTLSSVIWGTAIVLCVNALLWPRTARRQLFLSVLNSLSALRDLQKVFFEIYLKRDYPDKQYFYEKKIQQQSRIVLHCISQLSDKAAEPIRKLYEIIVSQGHLRFRIKDFSTFEIVDKEFKDLNDAGFDTQKLPDKIMALENLYHGTLQVVAADPLAFLLFLQALQDMETLLNENHQKNNLF